MSKVLNILAKVQMALAVFEGLHEAGLINLAHQPTIDHVTTVVANIIGDVAKVLAPAPAPK